MRLQHIAEEIYQKPWLITASGHKSIQRVFEAKLAAFGSDAKLERAFQFNADDASAENPFYVQRPASVMDANGIGRVYIKGVVGLGLSRIEKTCGNTDTKDVATEIKKLLADGAKAIFLSIDTPGGMVTGTPELADLIAGIEVPVYIFTEGQLCSAGYWIASGATKILSTDSAEVGSIGVIFPWVDSSGMWEKMGIESDPIINQSGIYKGTGAGPSLTDDQREALQQKVDRIFGLFKGFVTGMRAINGAVVPDEACQGQTFLGIDAQANGLVDQVVGCEDEAYDLLVSDLLNQDDDIDDNTEIDFQFPENDPLS